MERKSSELQEFSKYPWKARTNILFKKERFYPQVDIIYAMV
jgi:hypothetical protein